MRRRACFEFSNGLVVSADGSNDALLYLLLKLLKEEGIAEELLTPANGFPPAAIELLLP